MKFQVSFLAKLKSQQSALEFVKRYIICKKFEISEIRERRIVGRRVLSKTNKNYFINNSKKKKKTFK